jgi:UDP-N-acetylmuramate--alanine ligase
VAEPASARFPDLTRARRVHLIGAGGAGMNAIGSVLLAMGHQVNGSDAVDSAALNRLARSGAEVHVGHDARWLGVADVVARSTAIPPGNVEVVEAARRGLRVWRRSELLAAVCATRRVAAVSGTHGKTSTSSMLALVLQAAGMHPSMIVGGDVAGVGSGAVWDTAGAWLVVEADESDGTFLELGAEAVVVTSVEPDHLDYFGSEEAMRAAYVRFVGDAPGPAVLCADDPGAAALARIDGIAGRTYGLAQTADVRIDEVIIGGSDSRFSLSTRDGSVGRVHLHVPGLLYVRNATAALTMAHSLGASWEVAIAGVESYRGVARRFERRGVDGGVTFIDDYGHLPGEVAATLAAARSGGWDRIVAVFQPHRYSRTEALWPEFAAAFAGSDVLVVTDVYGAGEIPRPGITGELIVRAVRDSGSGIEVRYAPTLDEVVTLLGRELRPGDLCLTLGAGDITTVPDRLIAKGEPRA